MRPYHHLTSPNLPNNPHPPKPPHNPRLQPKRPLHLPLRQTIMIPHSQRLADSKHIQKLTPAMRRSSELLILALGRFRDALAGRENEERRVG